MNDRQRPCAPAEDALQAAHRHGDALKAVNAQLANLVTSLRESRQRFAERVRPPEATSDRTEEKAWLGRRLAEIEVENRRLAKEYVAVQEQISEIVLQYVALRRLHATLDRREVLTAVEEILVNMVGSEDWALFELAADGVRLLPVLWSGPRGGAGSLPEVRLGAGVIGRAAASREISVAVASGPSSGGEAAPAACVPLLVGEKPLGVIAIFRLLAHKRVLTAADRDLLELLGRHAATALHCAALHGRLVGDGETDLGRERGEAR